MGTLDRAVQILRFLAENGDAVSLTEIAEATGIPASSAHRVLSSLKTHFFVIQDGRRYRLGFGLVPLAQRALNNLADHGDATPYLTEITGRWNEVSSVCALVEDHVVCLQVSSIVNEPHRTQFFVRPGQIMPFNGSASGKVILAYQDLDRIETVISENQFTAYTTRTITDAEEFRQHLRMIREQGYALCEEELEIGVSALAVPIKNVSGKVISCLAVVAPTARLQAHLENGMLNSLRSIGHRMSLCSIAN